MNPKHTPTPYRFKGISENGKNHFNVVGTTLGCKYRICQVPFVNDNRDKAEAESTARFIVKACNSHDRLVEALDWAVRIFEMDSDTDWLPAKDRATLHDARQLLTELKA